MSLLESTEEKDWFKKCKKIILDPENENPFPKPPIAINFYNNPPLFCYGREEQLSDIINEIKKSIDSFEPKLVQVMGKQGIGKSTLICWCANNLIKKYQVPIVYLETSAQPEDFKMKSLYRQIISKIEKKDIIYLLLYNSVVKFITIFKESGGKLYEQLSNKFSGEEIEKLLFHGTYIEDKIKDTLFAQKIFELLNNNILILKQYIPIDLNFLLIFWKSHIQNPEYLQCLNAFKGVESYAGYCIQTDNDASDNIDKFIELFRWVFDNKTTLVIIIDHLEAGISQEKESVFSNLFSLLLNLRQKKYMTIILSGTLDAYLVFSNVLEEDQQLQLNNWSKTIALTNLAHNDVIQIIEGYLQLFWNKFNYHPSLNSLFPFGSNSIKYLYENNGLDLRKTLRELYELIETYRKNQKLDYIDSFFKAFKVFRKREDVALSFTEQKELKEKLLDSTIQDKTRSTNVELAFCNFFEILRSNPDYNYLTDVKHEPPLGKSNKKPDVFLEFFGNEGLEFVKKLGIEVKVYRKTKEVHKDDIEKTYLLLKENALDYVSWITNVPLDIKYRYKIKQDLSIHLGRISPLNELELSYLSFMVYFSEIFDRSPKIEEIEFILNKLNLSPIKLKDILKNLPKLTKIPESPKTTVDITTFISSTENEQQIGIKSEDSAKTEVLTPVKSVEIGLEQIKSAVKDYINKKSTTNKQITASNTIKEIRKILNIEDEDTKWDEDIWAIAIDISKITFKTSPKTIYFK